MLNPSLENSKLTIKWFSYRDWGGSNVEDALSISGQAKAYNESYTYRAI